MISDGVLANAANFNAAFESKNKSVVTKTADYTATSSDYWIICNTAGGAFTITLPAAASNTGLILGIIKGDTSTNLLTIDPNASETINGYANIKLQTIADSLVIISNGVGWNILSNYKYGQNYTAVSTTYTALPTDDVIGCDPSSASFTVTLPDLATYRGKEYTFIRTNSGAALDKIVTIAPNGSDTIDGDSSKKLATFRDNITLIAPSTGTAWVTKSRYINSEWVTYTPTISGFTAGVGTVLGKYRRIGENIECQIHIPITGAVTGTDVQVSLPTNLTFDTAKMVNSSFLSMGGINAYNGLIVDSSASAYYFCTAGYHSSTKVFVVGLSGTSGGYNALATNYPIVLASGDYIQFGFSGPITNWEGL